MSFEIKYDNAGIPIQAEMPQEMKAAYEEAIKKPVVEPLEQETSEPDVEITGSNDDEDVENTDIPEVEEPEPAPEPVKKKGSTLQENWQILRDKAAQAEKRAEEAERRAEAAERAKESSKPSQPVEEDNDDSSVDDDELIEGKQFNQLRKQIRELKREQEQSKQYNAQKQQEAEQLSHQNALRAKYSDFDTVVTAENLKNLASIHPEMVDTIRNSPENMYKKGITAYSLLKSLGFGDEVNTNHLQEKHAARINSLKPRPVASIAPKSSSSPLAHANSFAQGGELTEELKAQLVAEMYSSRKNF